MQRLSITLSRLTLETAPDHASIDSALAAPLEFPSVSGYRRYLCTLYGFLAPLEASLILTPGIDLPFVQFRLKAGLLANDVMSLGLTRREFGLLSNRHTIPAFGSVAEALGWLYVVERTTLQHENLCHRVATEAPVAYELASSYLNAYDGTVRLRWRELGAHLDQVASSEEADRIVAGAHAGIASLHDWLDRHAQVAAGLESLAS
ncbi:MAG: biliverdin-producing heme oxygenase [Deltaproteobacteria bacterium]|nr:biliverdin-producing heme oxygenase [Deltaproteobacteria bacterium]